MHVEGIDKETVIGAPGVWLRSFGAIPLPPRYSSLLAIWAYIAPGSATELVDANPRHIPHH